MKRIVSIALAVIMVACVLGACGSKDANHYDEYPTGGEYSTVEIEKNPTATVTLSTGEKFTIELYYYTAPNTVSDFIALAKAGQYDGMAFNKVKMKNYVMLGNADGSYSPDYFVKDEVNKGTDTSLSHVRGVVSMIRETNSNRIGGQFFVVTQDAPFLDNNFTSFGTITDGVEIFDKIAATEPNSDGLITDPVTIESVKVNTYGVDFPYPVIIPAK